jgi:pimeloyl-ACP methyl ester carboxylesterase
MPFRYREVPNRSWTRVPDCQRLVGTGCDERREGSDERVRRQNAVIVGGRTVLGRVAFTCRATNIDGAPTVLFIHGSLDDAAVWGGVIAALDHKVNTVTYDLPGFGSRAATVADPDAVSLESLAAEAGEMLNAIDTVVIVVGQCMGAQIAEIVAADHAERVVGLVLLTPVPLGGTHLPDEEMASFRDLANHPGTQRAARSALSPALTPPQLDRLVAAGTGTIPEVVARYADIWNDGVKDAPAVSDYAGPVLVIRGGIDAFVTEQLASAVAGRFADVREHVIDRGGHWLHIEHPGTVAATILEFNDAVASGMSAEGWRRGFADQSQSAFAQRFADDIVLEATTLANRSRASRTWQPYWPPRAPSTNPSSSRPNRKTRRQRTCNGVQRLSAACRSTASQFSSITRAARSSQPPSTTGRWAPCCDSLPRSAIDWPA